MLNAVGLSSPGLLNLLLRGEWQKITSPFGISLAAISSNPKERLEELQTMVCILRAFLPYFHTFFFIEYNPSCPNVGHNPCDLEKWILPELEVLSSLGVILSVKLSPTVSFETVRDIEQSGLCSWISFANTIPFGKFPDKVDWKRFFGTANPELSPLRRRGYGAGGFSGWPSIDIVPPLIQYFHDRGITTPFLGGSGIGYRRLKHLYGEIKAYHDADTDALQFGGMFPMRPWLVKPAIRITNEMFGKGR